MLKTILLAASFVGVLTAAGSPASAEDYPYCLKNDGGPGDCKYVTYEQCLAAVSGRDGYCQRNPWVR